MDALQTAKNPNPSLAMTLKEPPPNGDPRFCAGHQPHSERLGRLERMVSFIAEKTGLHFNMDEFHAAEAKRDQVGE